MQACCSWLAGSAGNVGTRRPRMTAAVDGVHKGVLQHCCWRPEECKPLPLRTLWYGGWAVQHFHAVPLQGHRERYDRQVPGLRRLYCKELHRFIEQRHDVEEVGPDLDGGLWWEQEGATGVDLTCDPDCPAGNGCRCDTTRSKRHKVPAQTAGVLLVQGPNWHASFAAFCLIMVGAHQLLLGLRNGCRQRPYKADQLRDFQGSNGPFRQPAAWKAWTPCMVSR